MNPEELRERVDAAEGRRAPITGAKALAGADEADPGDAESTDEGATESADNAAVEQPAPQPAAPLEMAAVEPAGDDRGLVALFFQEMFRPIDGLFILLAFFTAYKVGSGKQTG
jgi:hypothetical protein